MPLQRQTSVITAMEQTSLMIAELKKGNRRAMQQLYGESVGRLTAVCRRYVQNEEDVKDILQESYIKIFNALRDFVPQNENSLNAWMARIVANEALNHLRRGRKNMMMETTDNIADREDDSEDPETQEMETEALYDMIRQLPEGYRTVLNLYVIEEYSHKEIAKMLGISEYTSASQLFHAKKALAKMIRQRRREL